MSDKNSKVINTICQKICFKTEKLALIEMEKINSDPSKRRGYLLKSVYFCPEHKKWHMTSMTKGQAETVLWKKSKRESIVKPGQEIIISRIAYLEEIAKFKNKFKK